MGRTLSNGASRTVLRGLVWHASVLVSAFAVALLSYTRTEKGPTPSDVVLFISQTAVVVYQLMSIWSESRSTQDNQIALLSALALGCFAALNFLRLVQLEPPVASRLFLVITASLIQSLMTALEAPLRRASVKALMQHATQEAKQRVAAASLILNGAISLGSLLWTSVEVIDAANADDDLRVLAIVLLGVDAAVFIVASVYLSILIESALPPSPVQPREAAVPFLSL